MMQELCKGEIQYNYVKAYQDEPMEDIGKHLEKSSPLPMLWKKIWAVPDVLNGIEIRALRWPWQNTDIPVLQEITHRTSSMAGGIVLLEGQVRISLQQGYHTREEDVFPVTHSVEIACNENKFSLMMLWHTAPDHDGPSTSKLIPLQSTGLSVTLIPSSINSRNGRGGLPEKDKAFWTRASLVIWIVFRTIVGFLLRYTVIISTY
ncbi:uncharacterized protein LOC127418834 [Myxocyprinus asiaticus]|uniref:uncharacterized protein LOC127418834 n=1 Tax=Myxocyprinus asiaticus TaxID=70543 RepID=UPI00222200EC|nr:uncharacterized protein LOC127418834 [Myxocyprinus asiaticus]